MSQTVLQEVQERIRNMKNTKEMDLEHIRQKQEEARAQLEAAETTKRNATERMDLESFEAAENDIRKYQTAIEMYDGRLAQLIRQEYVTEEESDRVIKSLLDYEIQIGEDFKAALVEPLRALALLHAAYEKEVSDTESTIREWTRDIHANYRNAGTIYKETGTDRSPVPVPVHIIPFKGCAEASRLAVYLEKETALIRDGE